MEAFVIDKELGVDYSGLCLRRATAMATRAGHGGRGLWLVSADWGGKDPAKCNRGLYRLATDTGTWTTLERGLPDAVEVRCVTLHPTQPGMVFAGTQAGPYRSTDAGDTWERMPFPVDEPIVWSCEMK